LGWGLGAKIARPDAPAMAVLAMTAFTMPIATIWSGIK